MKLRISSRHQEGVTLFEALLVIALGGLLIILSMNQYQVYQLDSNALQVQKNIDVIATAAAKYYRAQCYGYVNSSQALVPGTLNPANTTAPPSNPFSIDIQNDLINNGYMSASDIIANPLVDSSGGYQGYVVQFNQTTTPRLACLEPNTPGQYPTTPYQNCNTSVQIGTIVNWQIQVSALMKDTQNVQSYQGLLSADCTSQLSGTTVGSCNDPNATPCNVTVTTSNGWNMSASSHITTTTVNMCPYLVWSRAPSTPTAKFQAASPLTVSMPSVQQFTYMYRTYPILDLTNQMYTSQQYYLCGN